MVFIIFEKSIQSMNRQNLKKEQNILDDSEEALNEEQQKLFLSVPSKSADSFMNRLLPGPNQVPERSLVFDFLPPRNNSLSLSAPVSRPSREKSVDQEPINGPALKIFKKAAKRERVKSKCDYEKNICGYITKKIIRQFVSKNYEKEVMELIKKYRSNYAQCKAYYLKKVQMVTGPSHLPELFNSNEGDSDTVISCKKVFKRFYRWFLKERYLRYLLLEGKMRNKMAYIEYKNEHLFKFVQVNQQEEEIEALNLRIQTRSRSGVKIQQGQE